VVVPRSKPVVGRVLSFDEARGLGEIEAETGWMLGFHCTAITDGTRAISPGTAVVFTARMGALGRDEAAWVRPLPGQVPPGDARTTTDALPARIPPAFSATPVSPPPPVVPPRPVPGAERAPYSFRVHRDGP
jgi:cold shock CspA family protein